jgi:hypothetical protein
MGSISRQEDTVQGMSITSLITSALPNILEDVVGQPQLPGPLMVVNLRLLVWMATSTYENSALDASSGERERIQGSQL